MEGNHWQTLVIVLAVLVMAGGAVAMVLVGRSQRAGREQAARDVNGVLRELATALHGELVPGKFLYQHPTLGELREYGVARVTSHKLAVEVTVNYPADDTHDHRTVVRVPTPPHRAWRVTGLTMKRAPAADADLSSAATFERCIAGARAGDLPDPARVRLLQLTRQALALELGAEGLRVTVAVDKPMFGGEWHETDQGRLRALVDEAALTAAELLSH
ncbi:MAG TPA: hypothetical protein VGB85_09720 [Nannocystis sp.]|jgi:hypothetical protein